MTAKDILQIEQSLDNIYSRVGKLDSGIAVILEKFDHVLTRDDVEKEVSRQIKVAQAECPSRSKSSNMNALDWIKIIKIIGVVSLPIIGALTGHQIGVH